MVGGERARKRLHRGAEGSLARPARALRCSCSEVPAGREECVRGVRWCAGSAVLLRIRVAVGRDVPHGGVEVEQLRLGAEGDPVEGGVRVPPLEPHREVDAREAPGAYGMGQG